MGGVGRCAASLHDLATLTKPNRIVNRIRRLRINVDNCDPSSFPQRLYREMHHHRSFRTATLLRHHRYSVHMTLVNKTQAARQEWLNRPELNPGTRYLSEG